MRSSISSLLVLLVAGSTAAANLVVPESDSSFFSDSQNEMSSTPLFRRDVAEAKIEEEDLSPYLNTNDPNFFYSSRYKKCEPYVAGNFTERYFNQKIDHRRSLTFRQRYYVNADYYKPGGPAFLYIGGESAARSSSVSRGIALALAKEHNGIIYALEHRFYGTSHPFKVLNADTLKYLSSENGLKDLVNFAYNVENPATCCKNSLATTKWFTIGGSYAGAMSAWIRQDRPDLFKGALASSGPVLAKEDFFEYDISVGKVLGDQCLRSLNEVVNYIDDIYTNNKAKFAEIKAQFGCKDLADDVQFLYTIYDTLSTIIQYNSPTAVPSVNSFCTGFLDATTIEQKYQNFLDTTAVYYDKSQTTCTLFANEHELLATEPNPQNMWKQWNYQCCTEFGYWQTAPTSSTSSQLPGRSRFLTVDWFNKFFCSGKWYGKNVGPPKAKAINKLRGGLDTYTSRTIWTNGGADPWKELSVQDVEQSTADRPITIIVNGSHVNDLGSTYPSANPSLLETQKVIFDSFRRWIQNSQ